MPSPTRVIAHTPITFETLDGGTEHAPMIFASIRGAITRFVLDTGSDVHLLTKDFAGLIGLALTPGEDGVDHSGTTMPSWSAGDAVLHLPSTDLDLRGIVVIPAPLPFGAWGIGGILSPQHLHPSAMSVIDMARDELLIVEASDDAIGAWVAARTPDARWVTLPRDPTFPTIVVAAAIKPFRETATLLNTGGRGTEFAQAVVPGLAVGEDSRIGGGVSSADVRARSAGAQTLVVAGREFAVADLAVRETMHDPQAIIGMDILRGTTLAVAADPQRPVVWQFACPRG